MQLRGNGQLLQEYIAMARVSHGGHASIHRRHATALEPEISGCCCSMRSHPLLPCFALQGWHVFVCPRSAAPPLHTLPTVCVLLREDLVQRGALPHGRGPKHDAAGALVSPRGERYTGRPTGRQQAEEHKPVLGAL